MSCIFANFCFLYWYLVPEHSANLALPQLIKLLFAKLLNIFLVLLAVILMCVIQCFWSSWYLGFSWHHFFLISLSHSSVSFLVFHLSLNINPAHDFIFNPLFLDPRFPAYASKLVFQLGRPIAIWLPKLNILRKSLSIFPTCCLIW